MGVHSGEKKQLSARGMLEKVRATFAKIPEPPRDSRGAKSKISLADCLMSGLALFGLKFPSLLQLTRGSTTTLSSITCSPCMGLKMPPAIHT